MLLYLHNTHTSLTYILEMEEEIIDPVNHMKNPRREPLEQAWQDIMNSLPPSLCRIPSLPACLVT